MIPKRECFKEYFAKMNK